MENQMYTTADLAHLQEKAAILRRKRSDIQLELDGVLFQIQKMKRKGIQQPTASVAPAPVVKEALKFKSIEQMTPDERVKFDDWVKSCAEGYAQKT